MKRPWRLLSLVLWAALPVFAQAAVLETQTVIRSGPATPVPVLGTLSSPLTFSGNPSLAAPSLKGTLSAVSALPVVPQVQALGPVPLAQTQSVLEAVPVQAAPALAAAGSVLAEPARTSAQEKPAESISAQAAQTFDGAALQAGAPVSDPPGPVAASAAAPKPLRLIITGPPGSGKGTYSQKISQEYGVVHISVGALLRDYAQTHPEVAKVMATGALVDSKLVLDVVRERLSQPDIKERGFILDGFPRRTEEAAALQEMLGEAGVDGVIELSVPEVELLRRILARGRADDKPEVFKERMKIYREQTVPAVERFKSGAPVLAPEVSGSDIASNYARVKAALGGLLDKLLGR